MRYRWADTSLGVVGAASGAVVLINEWYIYGEKAGIHQTVFGCRHYASAPPRRCKQFVPKPLDEQSSACPWAASASDVPPTRRITLCCSGPRCKGTRFLLQARRIGPINASYANGVTGIGGFVITKGPYCHSSGLLGPATMQYPAFECAGRNQGILRRG